MQTSYADAEHGVTAYLVRPGELTSDWTIAHIHTETGMRGHGYASVLFQRILADADAEGIALQVDVFPSDGLSYDAVTAWCIKYGFRPYRYGYMRRRPRLV